MASKEIGPIIFWGFEKIKKPFKRVLGDKWYCGFFGFYIFGSRFLGFNIRDTVYLRSSVKTLIDKNVKTEYERDILIYLYIFFYCISIEVYNKHYYK